MSRKMTRLRLENFLKQYASDRYTLDIGSGDKYYREFFPNSKYIDIDPARSPDVVADAHALPFPDKTFEQIVCTEVLEHLHTPEKALNEMWRVLKPGGRLILTTRFIFPIHDAPGDYFRFTEYGLRHLLRGWKIQDFRAEAGTFDTLAILFQRLLFQTRFRMNKAVKAVLLASGWLIRLFGRIPHTEFGDIRHRSKVANIMASGYYVMAIKE